MPGLRLPNGFFTPTGAIYRADIHERSRLMLDLIYVALAVGGFLAFAAVVRACEHL